jgi:hypothetical protein
MYLYHKPIGNNSVRTEIPKVTAFGGYSLFIPHLRGAGGCLSDCQRPVTGGGHPVYETDVFQNYQEMTNGSL